MQVHIFSTDDGTAEGTGPLHYVPDDPAAIMLAHPRGLEWRYFATVGLEDALLAGEPEAMRQALREGRSVVSKRLVQPAHVLA